VKSSSVSGDSRAGSPDEQDGYESDAEELAEETSSGLGSGKRRALDDAPDDDGRESKRSRVEELEPTPISFTQATPVVDQGLADNWVILLQGLIKGKAKMNREVRV
jgi:hypothetical protein